MSDILSKLSNNPGKQPDPDICLYGLAMALRSEADGSAEGCTTHAECIAIRDYLLRRLANWRPNRAESERHFQDFLLACVREAEAAAPYLFLPYLSREPSR